MGITRDEHPADPLVSSAAQSRRIELGFLRGMAPAEDLGDDVLTPLFSPDELDAFEARLTAQVLNESGD